MNKTKYKMYEDIAKQKGKQLFVEECSYILSPENAVIYDQLKLVEDTSGNKYSARGILKNVPVAKYNEKNANGRVYPVEIGKKIQEKKLCEGDDCFGNHADDEESVFDTVGVWHNYNLKENIGYADLYCIGEGGQLILEKAKAGGKIGFSTVSYGELKEDDVTVNPDTWESGHLADFVVSPSAGVYGTFENLQESAEKKDNILVESITNNISKEDDKILMKYNKEEKRENIMVDKLQEASLKNQIRVAIKEAKASTSIKEAIEDLKGIKETVPTELVESHAKIEQTISELTQKLEEQVHSTKEVLKEKENSLDEISAKYQTLEAAHNKLKEDYKKAEAIVSSLKEGSKEDVIKIFESNEKLMKEDIQTLQEEIINRDKDIKVFVEERKAMLDDLKMYEKREKKLKESLGTCQLKLKKKVKEDEEYGEIGSYGDADPEDLTLPEPDEDVLDVDLDSGEVYDMEADIEPIDSLGLDDDLDAEGLMNEEEDDKEDEEDEDEEKMEEEEEGSDEDKEEDDKEDEDKKEKKEESKRKVLRVVFEHYKKAVKKNRKLEKIRKQILTSKSLMEAVKKIEAFEKAKIKESEIISLKESGAKIPNKIVKYEFKR